MHVDAVITHESQVSSCLGFHGTQLTKSRDGRNTPPHLDQQMYLVLSVQLVTHFTLPKGDTGTFILFSDTSRCKDGVSRSCYCWQGRRQISGWLRGMGYKWSCFLHLLHLLHLSLFHLTKFTTMSFDELISILISAIVVFITWIYSV